MPRIPRPIRELLPFVIASFLAYPAFSQSILVTEHGGKPLAVFAAKGARPYVEIDGKRVLGQGTKFGLRPVTEFLPVFVKVRGMRVETSSMDLVDTGAKINNEIRFRADFESPFSLQDVFLVLELTMEDRSQSIFLYEIGTLRANRSQTVATTVRSGYPLGSGHFTFHIYSGGLEVLHSEIPFNVREAMLDKLIARRITNRPDGPPSVFFGPTPEYPPKLGKTKTAGQVMMRVRIRPTGAVVDAAVESATEDSMGESALTAIRQWRFLPGIKEGRPVETVAVIPIDFHADE